MQIEVEKQDLIVPQGERKRPEKVERKKSLTCPTKTSTFFITINSNQNLDTASESEAKDIKAKFDFIVVDFLKKLPDFTEFKTSKLGVSYGYGENDTRDILQKKDRILQHEVKYVFEKSPSGRLHVHIMYMLKKKGCDTKLMLPEIREHFKNQMQHSVYVNYKLHGARSSLEDYMRKNPLD